MQQEIEPEMLFISHSE